ncbi:hypothetical protein BJ878DRAFT_154244 [Calycina marina]|uniref:Uncharacterized protein n=1 Tax=Calycina marina TaxID=1763456 RepID=A0A9P7Z000_9HELO|nr:hypothetical protein BJ878DRAFT_154244 [Calycina marina]
MSTPAAKRRRIDAASNTLSKPFRSPFKTPFKSPVNQTEKNNTSITYTPLKPTTQPKQSLSQAVLAEKASNLSLSSLGPRKKKTFNSLVQATALNAEPDIAPMLKKQRDLEKQLREVKEELDQAEQARKIERDSEKNGCEEIDGELVELCVKWKGASRQAAEELFGKVRDRVNRMGGPRAWKEAQKKQQESQGGWDEPDQQKNGDDDDNNDDDNHDDDGEKNDVEKRDLYAEYGIDPETENEKSQRAKGVGDTGELPGQEDEFTMAMMLRTLNVELDIIGYDREAQIWVD